MARFSQYTITQVAGFDNPILAQQLVYNQKDFWNFSWGTNTSGSNGWNVSTNPINLTGATINAQIIRRQITNLEDTRTGLNFDILTDYPFPKIIESITSTSSTDNTMTTTDTDLLFINQPVQFTGTVFGNVAINTTYYIKEIITRTTFTISTTSGGSVFTLATASGEMYINRVAPTAITLPISNRNNSQGTFTMTIDDDTWGVIAGDPELNISATTPVCFTGRVKISFPSVGTQPAYDESIFILFLIVSDGVVN